MKPQNVLDDQTPKGSHIIFTYTYFIYSNISHNYFNSFYIVVQVVVKNMWYPYFKTYTPVNYVDI